MIADEYRVLSSLQDRNQRLWLSGLGGLVYENLAELKVAQAPIERGHARRANNVSLFKNLLLCLSFKILQNSVILL